MAEKKLNRRPSTKRDGRVFQQNGRSYMLIKITKGQKIVIEVQPTKKKAAEPAKPTG